jgi:hypothetical protein
VLEHSTICWINANSTKCKVNRAINVANGISGSHLALDDCEDSHVECAAVLFGPRLKGNLNAERPKIGVKEIVDLLNACATPNRWPH